MSDIQPRQSPPEDQPKYSFDREKVIFEQDCQEFRSLNGFLWQIPVIVSTLTGGLWFGVTKVDNDQFIRASLFLLAAVVNLTFIVVLWRLRRGVMEPVLKHIHKFQERCRPQKGRFTIDTMFTILLALSALISLVAFRTDAQYFWTRIMHALNPGGG
jgi:hypothetical protein